MRFRQEMDEETRANNHINGTLGGNRDVVLPESKIWCGIHHHCKIRFDYPGIVIVLR